MFFDGLERNTFFCQLWVRLGTDGQFDWQHAMFYWQPGARLNAKAIAKQLDDQRTLEQINRIQFLSVNYNLTLLQYSIVYKLADKTKIVNV